MKSKNRHSKAYRHHTGKWLVRFKDETGKIRNKVVKGTTERNALQSAIRREDPLDYWFPLKSIQSSLATGNFQSLTEQWLNHVENVREVSDSCLKNYKTYLVHHVLPCLGEVKLSELSLIDIEKLAETIKTKRPMTKSYSTVRAKIQGDEFFDEDELLSTSYRREILTVTCMIAKYAHERKFILSNPFTNFKLPKAVEQPYDFWTHEEEDQFLSWLEKGGYFYKEVAAPHSRKQNQPKMFKKRFKLRNVENLLDITLFALRSGLRKGEIGALTPMDINFEENFIIVRRSYSEKEKRLKNTTKGKTFRRVEMNADMSEILERRVKRCKGKNERLFNTSSCAIKNFSKYCQKAEVRAIHFHSLRHTCLTNLANGYGMEKPIPIPQVQKIAGHKNIATTMRYVHTDGIENTVSLQPSRTERKAKQQQHNSKVANESYLRLVST